MTGGAKYKICRRCLDYLSVSPERQEDLSAYLMATSSSGVEMADEADCQPKLVCARPRQARPASATRGLEQVNEDELRSALEEMIARLRLTETRRDGVYDLAAAIRGEWLKALGAPRNP